MQSFLAAHRAAASFLWGVVKTLIPLPSPSGFVLIAAEAARPTAGARQAVARLLTQVVLPGAAGVALGGAPYYLWARRAGRETVARWGPRFGIPARRIEDFERRAERRRAPLVWGLFALPLSPTVLAAVAAGLLELGPGGYAAAALGGAVVRIAAFATVGWALRFRFGDPTRLFRPWQLAASVVAVAAAGWALRRRLPPAEPRE